MEEDLEVMQELKSIRHGVLSHKNMTVREAEQIQHVLKVWCRLVCAGAAQSCGVPARVHTRALAAHGLSGASWCGGKKGG